MWFTILNRSDESNNLYKKALKKLFEIKSKTEDDKLILCYGYISWYDGIIDKMEENIFENIFKSGVSRITVVGTDSNQIAEYIDVVKGIEDEANKMKKSVEIVLLIDRHKKSHKKVAIRHNINGIKGALLGSSNLTETALFEGKGKFIQRNLDIYFGDKETVKKIAKLNKNQYYEKMLEELQKSESKVGWEKYSEDLIEMSVGTNIEVMLKEIIYEIDIIWSKNYYFVYGNNNFIDNIRSKEKAIKYFIRNLNREELIEGMLCSLQVLNYLNRSKTDDEKREFYENIKIDEIQKKLINDVKKNMNIEEKSDKQYEKKRKYYEGVLESTINIRKEIIKDKGIKEQLLRIKGIDSENLIKNINKKN